VCNSLLTDGRFFATMLPYFNAIDYNIIRDVQSAYKGCRTIHTNLQVKHPLEEDEKANKHIGKELSPGFLLNFRNSCINDILPYGHSSAMYQIRIIHLATNLQLPHHHYRHRAKFRVFKHCVSQSTYQFKQVAVARGGGMKAKAIANV